jgi:Ca2+:H+ antiporter
MPATETTPCINGNGDARRYSTFTSLFTKTHTPGEESDHLFVRWPATGFTITKITLLSNYVNILLVFVPLGIVAGAMGWNPTAVFILNFFAIIPLAAVLSFATEEISMKLGETMGGLLNATFGNAVELIVRLGLFLEFKITKFVGNHYSSKEGRDQNRSV